MKSKDIIKALECCDKNPDLYCDKCPFKDKPEYCLKLSKYALKLIKNQQAEIERLKKLFDDKCDRCIEREKTEAYKEFAEFMKENLGQYDLEKNKLIYTNEDIDNAFKELTERKEDK